jgi:hypothetical protein
VFTWHLSNLSAFVAENFIVLAEACLAVFPGVLALVGSLGGRLARRT